MKKAIKELNIEEFTRLLCDWPAKHTIAIKVYDQDTGDTAEDTVEGTYAQLSEYTLPYEEMHKWVEDNLYDYKTPVSDIEVYDYLSEKTSGFEKERVRVVLKEMEFWHLAYISGEKREYARKQYEDNKWEMPLEPRRYIPFTDPEDERNKCQWVDQDAMVKKVFGIADEYFYARAISLLKSKVPEEKSTLIVDTIKQKFEGLQTDEFINLLFGYVPSRINYLMLDPFMLGTRFLADNKDLKAQMKEVEEKMELLYAEFYGRLPYGGPRDKYVPTGIRYSALRAAAKSIREKMVDFLMGWIDKYKDEEGYEGLIEHCTYTIKHLNEVGLEPIYSKTEYTNYLKAVTNNFAEGDTKDLVESLEENARLTYSNMCKLADRVFEHNQWDKPQDVVEYEGYDGETDEVKTMTDYITAYDYMIYRFFGDAWAKRYVQVIDILMEKTGMDFREGRMYRMCKGFGKTEREMQQPENDPGTTKVSPELPINRNDPQYMALAGLFHTDQFDEQRIDKLYKCLRDLKSDSNAHNAAAALALQFMGKSYCKKKMLRPILKVIFPIAGVDETMAANIRESRIGQINKNNARKAWRSISRKESD